MEHAKIYRTKDQGSFEKKLGVGIKDDRKKNSIATKQSNHFCQLFERTKQIYKRKDIEELLELSSGKLSRIITNICNEFNIINNYILVILKSWVLRAL